MRVAVRADASSTIGGGHVMRCLSLAIAARDAGHDVGFICADVPGHLGNRIEAEGFDVARLPTRAEQPRGCVESWRPMPVEEDVVLSLDHVQEADWVVLDHYGLGGAWVTKLRQEKPELRVLCLDDLDCEPLFADLLLDQMALYPAPRRNPALAPLEGPHYALLRPEFATTRAGLNRAASGVRKVLILPGMVDTRYLSLVALKALEDFPGLSVEVIMGAHSPSRVEVERLVARNGNWSLSLNVTNMAERMAEADLCIGAGGGAALERCCLGLPSVLVPLADNQLPIIEALTRAGAAIGLTEQALSDPRHIGDAVRTLIAEHEAFSQRAAGVCDGKGAARVVEAMGGALRPVVREDAKTLFDWRNRPEIRAASLNPNPLNWATHLAYFERIAQTSQDGLWMIYSEGSRDLGHVNAVRTSGAQWAWSFYIGEPAAPRGAGRRMLSRFMRRLLETDFDVLTAQVLPGNERSLRLHDALGFVRREVAAPAVVEFTLNRCYLENMLGLNKT